MNLKRFLRNPALVGKTLFRKSVRLGLLNWLPDSLYLKLRFKDLMDRKLNFEGSRDL